jgi:hypothetical protein
MTNDDAMIIGSPGATSTQPMASVQVISSAIGSSSMGSSSMAASVGTTSCSGAVVSPAGEQATSAKAANRTSIVSNDSRFMVLLLKYSILNDVSKICFELVPAGYHRQTRLTDIIICIV